MSRSAGYNAGSDSCKWLLTEGRYKGDKEWQPYGCMMHHYTQTDSRRCMRYLAFMGHHNHFVFTGDARQTDAPSVIVAGSAAAVILAKNNSDTQLYSEYSTGLIRLVQPVDFLAKKGSRFLWLLQDPVLKERLPAQLSSLDNKQINLCNKAAEKRISTYAIGKTNFFMKENKYYSEFSFWLPLGYILALGLFFTEDRERGPRVLNREQTDEWRGLMQAVVLIYHVTGAKNVLPIYMYLRLINSAYLFLSGYGHFYYFWQTGDVSLVRFARAISILPFCTIGVILVSSDLFSGLATTQNIFRKFSGIWTESLAVFCFETAGSCVDNYYTIYVRAQVFFEKVFVTRPWKALFVTTDDDIREWWSRWRVDRYSVVWGLTFGAGLVALQRLDHIPGTALSSVLALISLIAYTTFTILCHSVSECEEIHSYVAFIPIIGYIALRNASLALRGKHSALLAGLGRISLETLVAQGHIWLAADSHGVLVLLPRFPVLNLLVTSFIFICASHEIHRLTHVLAPYAVPNDWKLVARNLLLFTAVLVPIGIHDGMF
ncbi:cas1 domain-containing protein 1 [Lasius niger]|uniref:Cas1 domain-containing protein 1 n=1 Tax=Lasius niger TaxID=67767 RepID=A0A0J7NL50_LASNI|nr:cas1 domain-containing protein 1 [Lasius niger]